MSKKEILEAEVVRRKNQLQIIEESTVEMQIAKTQQLELDNEHASTQQAIRTELSSVYRESRHYEGKEPRIFTEAEVKTYPYFRGEPDDSGNPYYRLSAIKAGDLGLSPLETGPTSVNGVWTRDKVYSPTEDVPRLPALSALQAYPDHTGEPLPQGWPGSQQSISSCSDPQYTNQTTCENNNETWTTTPIADPVWVPSETAPEVLRATIEPWKRKVQQMLTDVHQDDTATEQLYQSILDEINTLYSLLPAPAVFVRATGNPNPVAWGQTPDATGALLTSINNLIQFAQTSLPDFITNTRQPFLQQEATRLESEFFTFIRMRLHQVNGSFSKYKAIEKQEGVNKNIAEDHKSVISELEAIIQSL